MAHDTQKKKFGALIIGDEILSGKRKDKHFEKIIALLAKKVWIL